MAKSKKKSKQTRSQAQRQSQPQVQPQSSTKNVDNSNDTSVIAAALNSAKQSVLVKVCRLCGTKDGPFLNIFDPEQITAQKIDQLMPFKVAENDDLPHKICFRCSAKVEELHEFVEKCIKTQENFHESMGKKAPVIAKPKVRSLWEEKLNKSNMSNDDICDALIKKAMEGIKDIPLSTLKRDEESQPAVVAKKELRSNDKPATPIPEPKDVVSDAEEKDLSLKQVKLKIDKCDQVPTRSTRSKVEKKLESNEENKVKESVQKSSPSNNDEVVNESTPANSNKINDFSFDFNDGPYDNKKKPEPNKTEPAPKVKKVAKEEKEIPPKPFNIMDHVCMIKVNGVGVLFQCKLCNRNFLKKEVVVSHSCAKNGVPKVDVVKSIPPPEPPKPPTVKYINTKLDGGLKDIKPPVENKPPAPEVKRKPKIGPASKVKRDVTEPPPNTNSSVKTASEPTPVAPVTTTPAPPSAPIVNFPNMPSMNGRFRLVPGPNNTFTLVEDKPQNANEEILPTPPKAPPVVATKRKKADDIVPLVETKGRARKQNNDKPSSRSRLPEPTHNANIIDLDDQSDDKPSTQEQPYPVGLFQASLINEPSTFTTPAMKKQSYTIVQTGNPSKLLISTKPQPATEEVPKKRQKKTKTQREEAAKEPFSVTLEDAAPPKDPGFFTFINVDPLLQPSYVLPTDNIIQESQISTSTPIVKNVDETKNKYSCNMCNETFTREKKLLTHIQAHYSKMDEEDQMRNEKSDRKRGRRS